MQGKHILLGVTGGIAAYKAPDLVRRLRERGAEVQVVMTAAAREFVTPTTFQAVSGRTVRSELWDAAAEAAMGHIELARWADAVLIAPASADFLARLAAGLADDLLTTLCLATAAPIAVAPAMNHLMWSNAATRANIATLAERGVKAYGPGEGDQACGETGEGRMLEPLDLAGRVEALLLPSDGALAGRRVLVTAGPTRERIDPVRFISNRSSGKMGFAVAQAAREAGASVVLVAGPVSLPARASSWRAPRLSTMSWLSSQSKALSWPTSLAAIMSRFFFSSLVRAFCSTDSVSAAKPTTNGRSLRAATVASTSAVRSIASSRVSVLFLIFCCAACAGR